MAVKEVGNTDTDTESDGIKEEIGFVRAWTRPNLFSSLDEDCDSFDEVDLAQDHSKRTSLKKGVESHTSDLDEFDRYLLLLADDRPKPKTLNADIDNQKDELSQVDLEYSTASSGFWAYVRSILERATPVGYNELPVSNSVVPKGPDDVAKFFTKVIGISDINPIHPNLIAKNRGIPLDVVLHELLHATKIGLVHMLWTPECVRCGGAACTEESLELIPEETYCDGCGKFNEINSLDNVKVVFILNNSVLHIPADNFACTPSAKSMSCNAIFTPVPATSTGSGFR